MQNKEQMKAAVNDIFDKCNFPEYLLGTRALRHSIEFIIDNPEFRYLSLTKIVYDETAKRVGSTVGAVEKAMRTVIESRYEIDSERLTNVLGTIEYAGKKKREAPMTKQFIYRILAVAERQVNNIERT